MLTIRNHADPMRGLFLLGWSLLLLAFAAAAAETIARTGPGGGGVIMSAAELWRALWPGAYMISEVRLSALTPWLWDPAISTFLAVPAWALLGFPGAVLAIICRPGRDLSPTEEEEMQEHEASLFLYDDLAREARVWAREEGDDMKDDDRLPNQDVIDLFEKDPDDDPDNVVHDPLPAFIQKRGE